MPTFSKDRPHFNVATFVILKNEEGEYLLQQRQNTSYMNGYWDSSASGHLERGETLLQCAVRETKEECGLVVSSDSLKLVHIFQHDVGDWPYVDCIYTSDNFSGQLGTQEMDKVASLQWFKPEDFPEKLTPAVHMFRKAGFPGELSYSYANTEDHKKLTGQDYEENY